MAASLFTLFVIPVAVEFLKPMAKSIGLYNRPLEAAGTVMNFFLSLAELPSLRTTVFGLGALSAGLWLDWLLRKLDRSRAEGRKNLGKEMQTVAGNMNEAPPDLDLPHCYAQLISTRTKAKGFGLWVPDRFDLRHMSDVFVGTLLSDGHFDHAKRLSVSLKAVFNESIRLREKEQGAAPPMVPVGSLDL
jgi:hypothetical protein